MNTYQTVQTLGTDTYAVPIVPAQPSSSLVLVASQLAAVPFFVLGSSLCALFPVWHQRMLSIMLPKVMNVLAKRTRNQRCVLLSKLEGRVLDVGAGGGGYFSYYRNATEVVALEPLELLHAPLKAEAERWGLRKFAVKSDSLEEFVCDEPFDWIILGNVLCEVHNVSSSLQKIDDLLKPGGTIYFCEHIARPSGDWRRIYQNLINPFWRRISGGCNCNHESTSLMERMGWDMVSWTFESIQVGLGPIVMGLARKRESQMVETL